MSLDPTTTTLAELALRILERAGENDWSVLIVPLEQVEGTASALAREVTALGDQPEALVHLQAGKALGEQAQPPATAEVVIVEGLDRLTDEDWQAIDRNRTSHERKGSTILVADEISFGRLLKLAPNLASWIGGSVWGIAPEASTLSPEAREARLAALRSGLSRTDAEVIELAQRGELPCEPPYAEWLVLLGRGDLLGQ